LVFFLTKTFKLFGSQIFCLLWTWSYYSRIYNYLCNQWLSPLNCEFESRSWRGVLDTTLCDKDCQWPEAGRWFLRVLRFQWNWSPLYITGILLKVALNTKTITRAWSYGSWISISLCNHSLIQCTGVNYHHCSVISFFFKVHYAFLLRQIIIFDSPWLY